MKTSLQIPDISQYKHGGILCQNRVGGNVHIHGTVSFQRHNVDVVAFADVNLANAFSNPGILNWHLNNVMFFTQLHVVKNVVGAVSDGCPGCLLFFRLPPLVCAVSHHEFGMNISGCPGNDHLCSQLF